MSPIPEVWVPRMRPRPFRLIPRFTRSPLMGWAYVRWMRRLWRLPGWM